MIRVDKDYCPNCSCDSCSPVNSSWKEEVDRLEEVNEELRRKVYRLENHIVGLTKTAESASAT